MYIRSILTILLWFIPLICLAGLDDLIPSICRIQATGDKGEERFGTGFVFKIDNDYIYILTAGHVVKDKKTVLVQFFHEILPSDLFPVEVYKVVYTEGSFDDLGVVKLKLKDCKYTLPKILSLADRVDRREIYTLGCAQGEWPTGFKGYLLKANNGGMSDSNFYPAPLHGRSGSGVFIEQEGKMKAIGIVILTSNIGQMIPLSKIKEYFKTWSL